MPLRATSAIVRRMKRGIQHMEQREEEEISAKSVRIVTKEGMQFPYPYPPPQYLAAPPVQVQISDKPIGVQISVDLKTPGRELKSEVQEQKLEGLNIRYSLVREAQRGQGDYAYANIMWQKGQLDYAVQEPPLSQEEQDVIEKVKRDLEQRLDIDFTKLGEIQAKQILKEEIQKSLSVFSILEERKSILTYYIERDLLGLGKLQPLMDDENIEDVSCDGVGVPIYIYHRDPRFGSMRTNIVFETGDELDAFVEKLAQKCSKSISVAEPLLDGALPDGSRVQSTLGTDIARKGSNFTIRKFTEKPLTPTHMLKFGTLDPLQLAYLWIMVENGKTILVSGGTATGKTSLLNALSLFIRPNLKVVSIEDTAELRLPLPHWIPHIARSPLSVKGRIGEVTLFDLLKSSLRQRPDYIIVGEVRGKEAFVLFQQIATGHPALATIHAASIPQLVDRLITPPISLPPSLIENIDIIVFLTMSRLKGVYARRTNNILEVTGVKDGRPETVTVFQWKPITDKYEIKENSVALANVARRLGVSDESIQTELFRRKKILEWMLERKIFDYRECARFISAYYNDPQRLMDYIGSE